MLAKKKIAKKKASPKTKKARKIRRWLQPSSKKQAKAETFDLSFPNPEKSKPALPSIQPETMEAPAPQEIKRIEAKKRVPHIATALLGSGLVTLLFAAVFLLIMQIGSFYTFCISLAIFVGFSILFYNLLETGG